MTADEPLKSASADKTDAAEPSASPEVDVIVRTLADRSRKEQLLRALDSIQSQTGVVARPIVVVNGDRYDAAVLESLHRRAGIITHYFPEPSAGTACVIGRRLVQAPYFMFLDDDDLLLEHALQKIVPATSDNVDWDVLITNRYCLVGGQRQLEVRDLMSHATYPLRSLIHENWLSPGASLFRTESVCERTLDVNRDNQEWTHVAFRLALEGKRLKFLDIPTAVYSDTSESLSKNFFKHQEGALDLIGYMKSHPAVDKQSKAIMERKYRNLLHVLSWAYWQAGNKGKAWRYHLRSMRPPFTRSYLLFSRKLLFSRASNKQNAFR